VSLAIHHCCIVLQKSQEKDLDGVFEQENKREFFFVEMNSAIVRHYIGVRRGVSKGAEDGQRPPALKRPQGVEG
jgi:hypothetical protein